MPEPAPASYADRVEAALRRAGPDADGAGVWRELGGAGVLADLYPPPTRTGRGSRPLVDRLRTLLTAVDRRYPLGVGLAVCVQSATVVPVLAEGRPGGPARAAHDAALAGRSVTGLAATDAGAAGSDLVNLTTTVHLDADKMVVTGAKRWVTAATAADGFLVLARHRPGTQFTAFTWVYVPARTPGLVVEPADTPFFRGSGVGHLRLAEVRLDADHVVGRTGGGLPSFARNLATERLAGALTATALTRRVLLDTRAYLTRRQVGGEPLWHNDGVRQRFARWVLRHRELAALCARLAPAFDTGTGLAEGLLLKGAAGLAVDEIVGGCAQFYGADGFATGGPQWVRAEAALFGIGGGATEVVLAGIADQAETLLSDGDRWDR